MKISKFLLCLCLVAPTLVHANADDGVDSPLSSLHETNSFSPFFLPQEDTFALLSDFNHLTWEASSRLQYGLTKNFALEAGLGYVFKPSFFGYQSWASESTVGLVWGDHFFGDNHWQHHVKVNYNFDIKTTSLDNEIQFETGLKPSRQNAFFGRYEIGYETERNIISLFTRVKVPLYNTEVQPLPNGAFGNDFLAMATKLWGLGFEDQLHLVGGWHIGTSFESNLATRSLDQTHPHNLPFLVEFNLTYSSTYMDTQFYGEFTNKEAVPEIHYTWGIRWNVKF